ncbi:MAG: PmoA family protein, partial [Pirellulaceae bacterium]
PMSRCLELACCLAVVALSASAAEFTTETSDEGVTVKVDGQLMTRYLVKSGAKPILWPVIGPTGKEMTRGYPMRPALPTEKADHPHQRSFWFTHGKVNDIDFWSEQKNHGNIVHREFLRVAGGPHAVIATRNDWVGPDGKKVCEDERTFTFGADAKSRWVDVDLVVKATDGDVVFGDTKEGAFGVRVAGTMDVTFKKGGQIVNSEGDTNEAAWGKPAAWVDYHGPVEGETLGIAILNHPSSFRYPTRWHVRTYGLFAANPFGLHDFLNSKDVDGAHTIKSGESMLLRYRVLFHQGDEKEGQVAESFRQYSSQK